MTNNLATLQPMQPDLEPSYTDSYFTRTREIVLKNGDVSATYAIFMRRPILSAPRIAIEWLEAVASTKGYDITIELVHEEGKWVGAGDPILFLTGQFSEIVELETAFLMKLGPACVAAYNAYLMTSDLPNIGFVAMDARHCAGREMADMMAYAASVGSEKSIKKSNAKGFIGTSVTELSYLFDQAKGFGTMPHALIGYAGSTLEAAKLFHDTYPDENLTVLVDYFAQEITDSLAVCQHFKSLAESGKLSVRLDTPGSRFIEGLNREKSYEILGQKMPEAIQCYRSEKQLNHLIGTGVSAAALYWMRDKLDQAGFDQVKIVASSGFNPEKCHIMAETKAPIDLIGTGSYLPDKWSETYATADIIAYNGEPRVKVSREFLIRKYNEFKER